MERIQKLWLSLTLHFVKWVIEDTMNEEGVFMEAFGAHEKEVRKILGRIAGAWYRGNKWRMEIETQ
jgi:hypothetical protein